MDMNSMYYIVRVHDTGEILEYEFPDLARAERLMSVEMLECSLWQVNCRTGIRLRLEEHKVAS